MSQYARVLSVAALEELRAALAAFGAEAREILFSIDSDVRRTGEWLEEQLGAWKEEQRKAEDVVFQAKQDLARRKMMRIGDRAPDTTEQEEALEKARARLQYAEDKVEATRNWIRELPHATTDYQGRARQLMGFLEGDLPRACALLEQKAAALESYLAVKSAPAKPESIAQAEPPPPAKEKKPS